MHCIYVFEDQESSQEFLRNLGPLEESILIIMCGHPLVIRPQDIKAVEELRQDIMRSNERTSQ